MSVREPVQWGVLIGRSVRPLPQARHLTAALLFAERATRGAQPKSLVVYRRSDEDLWRMWSTDKPIATQLSFDLADEEASQ